jgi:hypothetical protein
MKVVIATPLYPPDVAEPAPYIKELAKRLENGKSGNQITIITYGHIPEKIPGVEIITVSKQRPLFIRIVSFIFVLIKAIKNADVLFAENGASVELPVAIVSLLTRKPLIMHMGDTFAHTHAQQSSAYKIIEQFALGRASKIFSDKPLPRPEIFPFDPYPTEAFSAYEEAWTKHLKLLQSLISKTIHHE